MKYVLLFVDTEEFSNELAAMGPAERQRAYERVNQWFADHADKITGGCSKLQGPETATTVRLDGREPVITDGPFVEGKEVVSGFAEIDVADLDEALRMVRTWPACPVVEIRPLVPDAQAAPAALAAAAAAQAATTGPAGATGPAMSDGRVAPGGPGGE